MTRITMRKVQEGPFLCLCTLRTGRFLLPAACFRDIVKLSEHKERRL